MSGVKLSEEIESAIRGFGRQALHAARLGLMHPASNEPMQWQCDLPIDMKALLATLREDARLAVHEAEQNEDGEWWEPNQPYEYDEEDDEDWENE